MDTKRWFYTLHSHIDSVSIVSTSEYGPDQGYGTESEAILAAMTALAKEIERCSHIASNASKSLTNLTTEQRKLFNRLGELNE